MITARLTRRIHLTTFNSNMKVFKMILPPSPYGDPLRYQRTYPVERVRSVKVDNDGTVVIEFDCLDDYPQDSIPGFENQPTNAHMGLSRENAERLAVLLTTVLAQDAA